MTRPLPAILWTALLAVAGCSHAPAAAKAPAAGFLDPQDEAERAPVLRDEPATHVGRVVLSTADVIVCGKVTRSSPAAHGAVVGHVMPTQWLRGEPREEGAELIVMSPAVDALPLAGRESLFVLASRRASGNMELIDVATLDDADGPARLATMRRYLEIEALPDPAERIVALRAYLRGALVSDERWTRSNAAREFAALAAEVPGTLTAEDRPPLESALAHTRDTALRALIQAALEECPGAKPRKLRQPEAVAESADPAAEPTTRYVAKDATVGERRQAVVDAAVQAGARGAVLFDLALDDDAAAVRDAAVAAVGEYRVESLEPKVAAILVADSSPVVRRTAVVAAGYLKSSRSVPTLAILAKDGRPFSLEATFALARIRDDAAVEALRALADEAADRERRELLAFLLSDAFLEQEKALTQKP